MSLHVIEGTWEEIKSREAELVGHRLRVAITPDPGPQRHDRAVRARYEYCFGNVAGFLDSHSDVSSLLVDAIPHIDAIFGSSMRAYLVVNSDQDHEPTLTARVVVHGSVTQARELRKRFDREWWMQKATKDRPPMTFDIDIV